MPPIGPDHPPDGPQHRFGRPVEEELHPGQGRPGLHPEPAEQGPAA